MTPATLILLAIAIPLVGAVLIWMSGNRPNQREGVTLVTAAALFAVVVMIHGEIAEGFYPLVQLIGLFPDAAFLLRVEPLGMMFALIASFLWIVNSIYSIGYMRGNNEGNQTRFYICFALAISSTMLIAFSGNLATLFLGYEALTLSTYPLVTHSGKPEAVRAGRLYLGILIATSIGFLLVAILAVDAVIGNVTFVEGGILGRTAAIVPIILLPLFVYGIGKAAVMPVHYWLPAAMVAPTPVSALLHAVAVVKAGVFTVVKVMVYVFGIDLLAEMREGDFFDALIGGQWLVYVSGFTVVAASIVALKADNLKRRLAYSTVSQLSYVVMAVALATPIAVVGAAMHIAAHAFGKITLFFAAGSIYTAAHKSEVSQLDGIGRRMPITMTAFAIAAISMIGLPPTAGFISKWYILMGAIDGAQWVAVGVLVASTLLNAGYFMPVVFRAFFRKPTGKAHGEAPLPILIAICITAAGTLALFFYPDVPLELAMALVAD